MSKKDFHKEMVGRLKHKRVISREELHSLAAFYQVELWQCPICSNLHALLHLPNRKHKILRVKE